MKRHLAHIFILAVFLVALPTIGRSQPTPRQRHIYGAGADSCEKWISTGKRDELFFARANWVLGYLTAVNRYARTPPKPTGADAVEIWLDNYCESHPLEDLDKAAAILVAELDTGWW